MMPQTYLIEKVSHISTKPFDLTKFDIPAGYKRIKRPTLKE